MPRLNGGVYDLVEKDISWQDVKNLVDAESLEANAQNNAEYEQAVGHNAGSSVSAGASAAACAEAFNNQERFLGNLAKEHVRAYDEPSPGANNH